MTDSIDDSVVGYRVLDADGERLGVVSGVQGDTAYVDPDPGITETIATSLGWDDVNEEDYPLPPDAIDRVTDDEIHLRRNA